MNSYIIATSSTCDLSKEYLSEHNIPYIRYTYTIGETLYEDDCSEESRSAAYKSMRGGSMLKTSMINEYLYYEFFKELLDTGRDVIFLDMSREMSVSFSNASKAGERIRGEYPHQQLYIMDTYCISGGLGVLVENMVARMEDGASFDEVVAWGEENKLKIAHRFTVDDLKYLKASGRVSNASALVGSLLSIKPVLYVPDRGTLDLVRNVRGRKAAIRLIVDGVLDDLGKIDPAGMKIRILHADSEKDAGEIRDKILLAHPEIGEITVTSLGVVIGAHVGPGLLAVFYLCESRQPE
ncbi:MAG: DegV family protein [Lachnospiraceae bacterium]|nr:DegV family protein [Lachnospiraceae bacterium]